MIVVWNKLSTHKQWWPVIDQNKWGGPTTDRHESPRASLSLCSPGTSPLFFDGRVTPTMIISDYWLSRRARQLEACSTAHSSSFIKSSFPFPWPLKGCLRMVAPGCLRNFRWRQSQPHQYPWASAPPQPRGLGGQGQGEAIRSLVGPPQVRYVRSEVRPLASGQARPKPPPEGATPPHRRLL